jgi:hypothetical protein
LAAQLGHKSRDYRSTDLYAAFNPAYLQNAVRVIDLLFESFHAVSTAEAELFGGFDRWRRTASGSLVDDDLTQVLDAVFGEGGHAILTHAVDPEAAVFGEHVDRQLVQPVFVLAEQVGDVADRKDGCDRRHDQAA